MARFRCGILPLEIEVRRYQHDENWHREICKICKDTVLEDEKHFFFECKHYDVPGSVYLHEIENKIPGFRNQGTIDKLKAVMKDNVVMCTAKFIWDIYKMRQQCIYGNQLNV